jgi:hypothetical protein
VSRVQLPSQTLWLHNNHKIVLRKLESDTYPLTTPEGQNVAACVRFAPTAAVQKKRRMFISRRRSAFGEHVTKQMWRSTDVNILVSAENYGINLT